MKKVISFVLAVVLVLGLTACGAKAPAEKNVDLGALYESFTLPEMYFLDESSLMNFLGIDAAVCKQYKVALCAEGMRSDEVWLIEAKDEAAAKTLLDLANTRIQAKLEETETYLPEEYVVVQKAQIVTHGNYLALLVSPDVDTLKGAVEAAFG